MLNYYLDFLYHICISKDEVVSLVKVAIIYCLLNIHLDV